MQVLTTKILSSDETFFLKEHGISLTGRDFIKITYTNTNVSLSEDAVLLVSSVKAVKALQQLPYDVLRHKTVVTVGQKAATALQSLGASVDYIAPTAADLLKHWKEKEWDKPVDFVCSAQRLDLIPDTLKSWGVSLQEHYVYTTTAVKMELETRNFEAILFFSPSAIKSYFSSCKWPTQAKAICIGKSTAHALNPYLPHQDIILAAYPDVAHTLMALVNYKEMSKK